MNCMAGKTDKTFWTDVRALVYILEDTFIFTFLTFWTRFSPLFCHALLPPPISHIRVSPPPSMSFTKCVLAFNIIHVGMRGQA